MKNELHFDNQLILWISLLAFLPWLAVSLKEPRARLKRLAAKD
ncbi:MAG TPA: hypothetical protein VLL54_06800 [Pyrinomonadaceae bacterium]|nr:hypothetical protein [Pyrinomonadaceae bacterium]